MTEGLTAAPVLSTPETHILNDTSDAVVEHERLDDEEILVRYEIERTIKEIKGRKWRRVALQFPDEMLPHSARVYQMLARGLNIKSASSATETEASDTTFEQQAVTAIDDLSISEDALEVKLTILGDTSYGSCCVDEIAAEHIDADAVVHYGRSCLSPTARLPVLHIFTNRGLSHAEAIDAFKSAFSDLAIPVILTADVPYEHHVASLTDALTKEGYTSLFAASILHSPSSAIPNRTTPDSVTRNPSTLQDWHLFHISTPPTSLLLTLYSSMASTTILSTDAPSLTTTTSNTSPLLRRRYALVTSMSTTPVWGILVNTLSVSNYMTMITHVQRLLADAGKKSYLFVVGKINPAKIANFAEIGGWVVIGCWESSLIDSRDFYKPVITPFELQKVLDGESRSWGQGWRGDFESVLNAESTRKPQADLTFNHEDVSDDEDEPPEFDLRTGRYVARTRPMRTATQSSGVAGGKSAASTALTKRANGDMISVNGIASPAAEYLANNRSWRGLEVRYDEEEEQEGGVLEEGRTGVASGYTVGESHKT